MKTKTEEKLEDLRRIFGSLPAEWERGYELRLTQMVKDAEVNEALLKAMVNDFNIHRSEYSEAEERQERKIAYAALYCLSILYRHSLDAEKFREIAEENKSWCAGQETFPFLEIMQNMHIPESLIGHEDRYLGKLYRFATTYTNNAGYAHAVADLYATICESSPENQEAFRRKWGGKAKQQIDRAIQLDPDYALYDCTKGRIALINGEYVEAELLFQKAIQKEDAARKDGYGIRISRYQAYQAQARAISFTNGMREQLDSLKAANISNIEILSFFAAIISLVLGSLSLAEGQTALGAAGLIVVLTGALLLAFSAFSFLLQANGCRGRKVCWANLAAAIGGAAVAIAGIVLLLKIQ